MLHLLQPIWLSASAAIAVPLVIHLWNVRKGKILKVGSVAFLSETAQRRARSLRLTERRLLLIRCLLIFLFSVLLAKPYWQHAKPNGWIVVQKNIAGRIRQSYRPLLDSLERAGYRAHWFREDFADADLSAFTESDTAVQPSYWQLVRSLQQRLPGNIPVYLFTDIQLRHFEGDRPSVSFPLTWKWVSDDTTLQFTDHAYIGDNDSLYVIKGTSSATRTFYQTLAFTTASPQQKDLTISIDNGQMRVRLKDNVPVPVDTSSMSILIYPGGNASDATYLQAVFRSIQQVTHRRMYVKTVSRAGDLVAQPDWLFWLSGDPLPASVRAHHVLRYANGNPVPVHSELQIPGYGLNEPIGLLQRIPFDQSPGSVAWTDGFGDPLLVKDKERLTLYTHFDPSWNDLVWNGAFPQLLYQMIGKWDASDYTYDIRSIDPDALNLPVQSSLTQKTLYGAQEQGTLASRVLWVLLLLLFVTERYLSFRLQKPMIHA